jgi:predicted acylesterase/phospholipase RssA
MEPEMYKPPVLVLSSGGTKGLGQLGTLYILQEEGILDRIETYIGASVGAVISLMLVCGFHPLEIFEVALRTTLIKPWSEMNKMDKALFVDYGMVKYDKAIEPMREMVLSRFGKIPTLLELYEITHKRFIVVTGNLTDAQAEYIDYRYKPNISCMDAVTMSMLVPGVLSKFMYEGKLYVDGAFVDPFPVHYLDDGSTDILGVTVIGTDLDPGKHILSYLYACISLAFDRLQELGSKNLSNRVRIIQLHLPDMSVFDKGQDVNKRYECFFLGMVEGRKSLYYKDWSELSTPTTFSPVPTHQVKARKKKDKTVVRH